MQRYIHILIKCIKNAKCTFSSYKVHAYSCVRIISVRMYKTEIYNIEPKMDSVYVSLLLVIQLSQSKLMLNIRHFMGICDNYSPSIANVAFRPWAVLGMEREFEFSSPHVPDIFSIVHIWRSR